MDFVKKQAVLAWKFYREQLLRLHLGCMIAFLAVSALSAVVFGAFAQQAQAIVESFMEEVQQSGLLDENGSISLYQYCALNNLSRATASRELKAECHKSDSPIDSYGAASHKVWVLRKMEE